MRVGIGVDAHRFATEGTSGALNLAGLEWNGYPPLIGHSDGDAVAHAICDALLSAASLGDLGSNFGTDDPALAGASGQTLLSRTAQLISAAGWEIENVAVQLVGNTPKIGQRRAEAETELSKAINAPVSLSATTTDGMGFTGAGEGLAAIATALLQRS